MAADVRHARPFHERRSSEGHHRPGRASLETRRQHVGASRHDSRRRGQGHPIFDAGRRHRRLRKGANAFPRRRASGRDAPRYSPALPARVLGRGRNYCSQGIVLQEGNLSQPEKYDLVVRVLSVTGLYLSHALPNVSDYEEPVPEPPYRCAPDEKLPQAQGYIFTEPIYVIPNFRANWRTRVCLWEAGLTLDFHQLSSIPKDTPESPPTESPPVASAARLLWRYWGCSPQAALNLR